MRISMRESKSKIEKSELVLLLPILFITTVFLFCVRARIVPSYVSDFFWNSGGEYLGDLYACFRMQSFAIITIVFSLYLAYCLFVKKVSFYKHKVYIPMIAYTVLVILSYMFSEYKEIAFLGYVERYEGTVTLVCYMLILFYAMHAVRSEKGVQFVINGFTAACTVLAIWGICQFSGIRLDSLPEWLYIPASVSEIATITAKQATDAVTLFFSNQNYTSFFMVFPICLFGMSCIAAEDMKKKVGYAVLTGLMMFCLWQAKSLGGMVGLAAAFVVALLLAGAENMKKWGKSLGLLALAAVISIGTSLPSIMGQITSSKEMTDILGITIAHAAPETAEAPLRFAKIEHIITDGKDIVFGFEGEELRIVTENNALTGVVDSTGAPVAANDLLQVSSYEDGATGYTIIVAKTAKYTWHFVMVENAAYFVTPSGTPISLDKVESIGFENNQDFATYRGYIWSRTFPMLKDTILLGNGADTYCVYFPQDDYAGRYNITYFTDQRNIVVDKPHNMYLGAAANTGVLSMVAVTAIYGIYLFESMRMYRKHTFKSFKDYIGMGICIAVAGFMVSGLVNDSTVQMMPIVYAFIGMGFAINRMLMQEKEEQE